MRTKLEEQLATMISFDKEVRNLTEEIVSLKTRLQRKVNEAKEKISGLKYEIRTLKDNKKDAKEKIERVCYVKQNIKKFR